MSFQEKYLIFNFNRLRFRAAEFRRSYPKSPYFFFGFAVVELFAYIYNKNKIINTKKEIEFRKAQLSKPVYELTQEESVEFPWQQTNLKEWLFRRVKISGRPIHGKGKLVPRFSYGHFGFDYIVPLVTEEKSDGSQRKGILLNLGWVPHQWKCKI